MSNLHFELEELRTRLTRLEQAQQKPRGRTNLPGAARYLGISDETLRQRLARGQGPRGSRNGKFWSFRYEDLDAHAEQATT